MVPIVSFIGWHNSGKTTLASRVVTRLVGKGFRVAVIKSSEHTGLRFDIPGTDTDKHRQAGAEAVVFVAADQLMLHGANPGLSLQALANRYFPDMDIVIGEGFKHAEQVPKIEVRRGGPCLAELVDGVMATVTDQAPPDGMIFSLDDIDGVTECIIRQFLSNSQAPQQHPLVSLSVNGLPVALPDTLATALTTALSATSLLPPGASLEAIDLHVRFAK